MQADAASVAGKVAGTVLGLMAADGDADGGGGGDAECQTLGPMSDASCMIELNSALGLSLRKIVLLLRRRFARNADIRGLHLIPDHRNAPASDRARPSATDAAGVPPVPGMRCSIASRDELFLYDVWRPALISRTAYGISDAGARIYFWRLFGACRRRTPKAGSNRRVASERSR